MKITFTTGGRYPIEVAKLSLENTGVNRFRASVPVQDSTGKVVSRTAEIEAASEKTKVGTVRVMLKCTIPYFPQMLDENNAVVMDPNKGPKPYTLHIVHTIPAAMASEALNNAFARQAAQVACLASQVISLGTLTSAATVDEDDNALVTNVPLQTGSPSVDGESSYPLSDAEKANPQASATYFTKATNVTTDVLAGSFLGRALAGLMPIDINSDKTVVLGTTLDNTYL